MGEFTAIDAALLIAIHAALTVVHGTVDDVADQTDIATHAALVNVHHARQHAINAAANHTGVITDVQHGVRATALAHGHGDLSGIAINDHHAQVHGVADHTDVTRELFIPSISHLISSGAESNAGGRSALVLGGANADEPYVEHSFKVPDDFVSFTSVKAVWWCTVAAGDMRWDLSAQYAAVGEAINIHTDAPVWGVTATGGVNILNVQEPANPLTLVNLALGDYLGIRFRRQGTNVADTLDANMYLMGLLFTYVASQ